MTSVFGIEDKVRQEMYKQQSKKKVQVMNYIEGLGNRFGG